MILLGLTKYSQKQVDFFNLEKKEEEYVIGLAGNPNTGKSSLFNVLTGLKQHTGNWPGKTVVNARGNFKHQNYQFVLVDVPGTYSLFGLSEEEIVARNFICFGKADVIVVVTDATALERNLNLVFQVLEVTNKVIMVVNLMDEARKKQIVIDEIGLKAKMGIPVIFTSARTKEGINELKDTIVKMVKKEINYKPFLPKYSIEIEAIIQSIMTKEQISRFDAIRMIDSNKEYLNSISKYHPQLIRLSDKYQYNHHKYREEMISTNYFLAEEITKLYVFEKKAKLSRDKKIDDIITSKKWGIPLMILLLTIVFFITLKLANYPSELLINIFFYLENKLLWLLDIIHFPLFLTEFFIFGIYRTVAWVVSVMLPPMAIFFPIFTLLEDLGYLPRVAFNLDHHFKKVCAHGKQCLSMCMGFGCNAAGVTGTRIIDSPRERLVAIITNTFVPCNGRFPMMLVIASTCFAITTSTILNSFISVSIIVIVIILGVLITLMTSWFLSKTILKGKASTFTLELPPYRKPAILKTIYTSLIDRTILLLGRAVLIAAPFGGLIWLLANIRVNDASLLFHFSHFLNPIGQVLGMDGIILLAFILALPANEIVLPIMMMGYLTTTKLTDFSSIESLRELFYQSNWTILTAINVLLFSLLHWPCSTTLLTIKKETNSWKWTFASFIIPTTIAFLVCILTNFIYQILV